MALMDLKDPLESKDLRDTMELLEIKDSLESLVLMVSTVIAHQEITVVTVTSQPPTLAEAAIKLFIVVKRLNNFRS